MAKKKTKKKPTMEKGEENAVAQVKKIRTQQLQQHRRLL